MIILLMLRPSQRVLNNNKIKTSKYNFLLRNNAYYTSPNQKDHHILESLSPPPLPPPPTSKKKWLHPYTNLKTITTL